MTASIVRAITIAIVSLAAYIAITRSKKIVEKDIHGDVTLRFPKFLLYFGYVYLALGVIFLITCSILLSYTSDAIFVMPFALFFFFVAIYFILQDRNKRFVFSNKRIVTYNLLGKSRELRWTQVIRVSVGTLTPSLILHSKNVKVKVNCNLAGGEQFIAMTKERLDEKLLVTALPKLNKVRGINRR